MGERGPKRFLSGILKDEIQFKEVSTNMLYAMHPSGQMTMNCYAWCTPNVETISHNGKTIYFWNNMLSKVHNIFRELHLIV